MMSIVLVFGAAILCAFSNLFLRRSIDAGGTSKAFLVVQQGLAIVVAILLNPVRTGHYGWNSSIAVVGIVAGLFLGGLMWALGKALENGPPGLTIATLNASNVVPAIIMVMLFGSAFGHAYHWWNGFGSLLVVVGLYWAVWSTARDYQNRKVWLIFSLSALLLHALFLVMIEWRALLIKPELPTSALLPFLLEGEVTQWFMPMIYVASTLLVLFIFINKERRFPNQSEFVYGVFGGVCNGACTFFLIQAVAYATMWQSAMLFPIFAVLLVVFCNLWGKWLYKENVHWKANALCLAGLFVGTVDWSLLSF